MPTMVKGEDGREIAEKLGDLDAVNTARKVHSNTGEVLTLIPYVHEKGAWVLDEENAYTFGAHATEEVPIDESGSVDLSTLTGAQLDVLAAEKGVEGYKKSAKVADRRAYLEAALSEA